MQRFIPLLGILFFLSVCYLFSTNRKAIKMQTIIWGLLLQFIFALLILKTTPGQNVFLFLNDQVIKFLNFAEKGASFVFGNLPGDHIPVGTGVYGEFQQSGTGGVKMVAQTMSSFAFKVLPTIIFFSSMMAILYYFGIMQRVIEAVAWLMSRTMKTSGAESLSAAANIFVGQTEAPFVVRPFIDRMTNSEIMAIMTGGFATIAGGVFIAYVGFLYHVVPGIAGHLLSASIMSAPAGLVMAKVMYPETEKSETAGVVRVQLKKIDANVFDAATRGASDGLYLALNVAAMLIAFVALIALVNGVLVYVGSQFGVENLTLSKILGLAFSPVALLIGIPYKDALGAGNLIGLQIFATEFVAYRTLAEAVDLSMRTRVVMSYALCGFANFMSIGIQIGGISVLAPSRRHDLARIGFRAMVAGAFACYTTACVAAIVI